MIGLGPREVDKLDFDEFNTFISAWVKAHCPEPKPGSQLTDQMLDDLSDALDNVAAQHPHSS